MAEHIIKLFDEELNNLRFKLVKMGSLVQEQIEFAIKSLKTNNRELAKIVLEREEKVDKLDIKIDKQCLRIFAQHQPYASDLRLVMSALAINDDLELIGDLAVYIAKNVYEFNNDYTNYLDKTYILDLAKVVDEMIIKAIDSFIYSDPEKAKEIIGIGEEIDKLWLKNYNHIIGLIGNNPQDAVVFAGMIDIIRNFQFVSDQCISIAREIIFLLEAKIISHVNQYSKPKKIKDDSNESSDTNDESSDSE